MTYPVLKEQLTYMMFPFSFSKDLNTVTDMPHLIDEKISKDKVYDHVANLISNEKESIGAIGKAYTVASNRRKFLGLPKKDQVITFKTKKDNFYISIEEIDVFLFETQIGFVSFNITIFGDESGTQPTMDEYVETNYNLKRFFYRDHSLNHATNRVDLEDIINTLTQSLNVKSFFENTSRPHHALIFSAVLLDQLNDEQKKKVPLYLYQLRRSFTGSYLPSMLDVATENNPEVTQPFQNSYWGVSLEGISNIAFLTGEAQSDRFFEDSFFSNLKRTYFYIYLIALQQKYSLIDFSIEAGTLHQEKHEVKGSTLSEAVNTFKEKVIRFLVRGNYKQVSYVTHHAELYKVIRKQLGIEELLEEVHSEVEALSAFIDIKEDRKDHKKERRTNLTIQGITLLLLPITVISGFFGMNIPIVVDNPTNNYFVKALSVSYSLSAIALLYILIKNKYNKSR